MPAIEVQGVSKRYNIGLIPSVWSWLPGLAARRRRSQDALADPNNFWALKDINFRVEQGSALGVIGRNGAGKTTLLSILCGVTQATQGRVSLRGRVAPLIALGAGFQPELTGRENIYLNAVIMGMSRAEVKRKFDSILDFAELDRFIDTPVKKYSSGMVVRLGFAVAAHLEPDVLLVDEVLSVGDVAFQTKCLDRIRELRREGVTLVLVSHNMTLVESAVDQCLLLDHGTPLMLGDPKEAIAWYNLGTKPTASQVAAPTDGSLTLLEQDLDRETGALDIERVWLEGDDHTPRTRFHGSENMDICIQYRRTGLAEGEGGFASVTLTNDQNIQCIGTVLRLGEAGTPEAFADSGIVRVRFAPLQLATDRYGISVIFRGESTSAAYARRHYGFLEVENYLGTTRPGTTGPVVLPPATWDFGGMPQGSSNLLEVEAD